MRVLHLVDRLSDRGGAYRHLLGVIEAQRRRGHETLLAAGSDPRQISPPCPLALVPGLEARERAPVELDALADRYRPDVVHLHTVLNPQALEWAAERDAVITVQDHRYFCPTRGKWTLAGHPCREPLGEELCAGCFEDRDYFREVYALTLERLEAVRRLRVIVLSRYMQRELFAAGVAPERIRVIPPFVHGLDPAAAPAGDPCVLFVGRLALAKGVRDALAAWHHSGVELPLVCAGTGPLRAELEAAGVDVLGWVPHGRLSAVYRRGRALLLPSRWQEPFGIVGLEALSLGVPVVGYRSGGIEEWHPGPGLVEWGDVEALSDALREAVAGGAASCTAAATTTTTPTPLDAETLSERLLEWYAAG